LDSYYEYLYIFSCQKDNDMNILKMLTAIAIVAVVTITAFGSFAVVTTPVLAQENMTSGGMTGEGNMTQGANMTSMMSNSTG
jgi:predicted exporter